MRHYAYWLLVLLSSLFVLSSCDDVDEATIVTGDVIAPVLKYINMPSQDETIPGTDIYIQGTGFSEIDVITCKSLEGEDDFTANTVSVDDYGITISIPESAGGEYEVAVTRSDLTTVLSQHLSVAFVFTIDNLKLPGNMVRGESATIEGEGFQSGDQVRFSSVYYPNGLSYTIDATTSEDGIVITIPDYCYGVNNLTVIRGKKTSFIGSTNIPVNVGDQIGGGVVFYTSNEGIHGLILAPENVVNESLFGPSVQVEPYAPGTLDALYSGKENTSNLVSGIAKWRDAGNSAESTVAELCVNYSVEIEGVVYNDWFLGSLNEMSALFNYRATLADPYALVPAQNYWTSTVFPGSNWAWAYYYVNFWESSSLVTGAAPCDGWVIAARPIRQF